MRSYAAGATDGTDMEADVHDQEMSIASPLTKEEAVTAIEATLQRA